MSTETFQGPTELSSEDMELFAYMLAEDGIESAANQPIKRRQSKGDPPQSFAQQRLWFLDSWNRESASYNVSGALGLTGRLNRKALEDSLNEIVRRHEALRTTFAGEDGRPVQVIADSMILRLDLILVAAGTESEREREIRRLALEEAQLPFDLTQGPLLRVKLAKLDEYEHVLLITMHHIICDGWSVGVLVKELAALYESFCKGATSPLSELPVQYADFAIWQREWLSGKPQEAQLSYWKQKLGKAILALDLPADHPRPQILSFKGARQYVSLSKDLTEKLKWLSASLGASLFITLLAAFKVLLYRYTNQTDILVGTPVANRSRPELEGLIGFFANTLVMRTELSPGLTFKQLLGRVRETALEAYGNQDIPFEQLIERLNPKRDPSRSPMFQVMIVLENTPKGRLELPGLTLTDIDIDNGTSKFDLTLWMEEKAEGITGYFEYNTDLFDAGTIARMGANFEKIVAEVVKDPGQKITEVAVVTEEERRRVLVEWNETEKEYGEFEPVHKWFEEQVERTPEATAAEFEGERLSYEELNRRANQVAHLLQGLGVGPDTGVGISVERSLDMVVGVMGILKSGGAYVPIDPSYPKERQEFMLEDTQTPVVLTQGRLAENLPRTKARIICLDAEWQKIAKESDENPISRVNAENLVYVVYTSGSTGRPKGVGWCHGSLTNMIRWMLQDSGMRYCAKVINYASLSFDVSSHEFFTALSTGATLVLMPEEVRRDAEQLFKFVAEQEIERLFVPFVGLQQFIQVSEFHEGVELKLKEIITAGEQLVVTPSLRKYFWKLPECNFHNQYGPSEGNVVTAYQLKGEPDEWQPLPPIGPPISNVQMYVLDERLNPTPTGVPGELYVGGIAIARGYLNRPDLTGEKFIPNPFSLRRGSRMYKTGDLARYLADGNLEFLGRIDSQVKIRGYRVELGEVEAILSQHSDVKEAAVKVVEDKQGIKSLAAYVVANEGRQPSTSSLRDFVKSKLPDYMVPSAFVMLDAFPLSPNLKVDRKALPDPDSAGVESQREFVAPRTPVEETLASIWTELLGIKRAGVYDDFFELGGHSLLATQLVVRIKDRLSVQLPVRAIFEGASLEAIARAIEQESGRPIERGDMRESRAKRRGQQSQAPVAERNIDSLLNEMLP